jgi:CheY-like chemotaxis protein
LAVTQQLTKVGVWEWDVEEQREVASAMLTKLGYSVFAVSSGEDALEYLKTNSPDLLVLDMIYGTRVGRS